METIQQQVTALQKSVQRQRIAIFVLAGICTAGALIGATKPVGDATFDTITSTSWKEVDGDGKWRIGASTTPDGAAMLMLFDKDQKLRIAASTLPDGLANFVLLDKDEKGRIDASTLPDGTVLLPTRDLSPSKP